MRTVVSIKVSKVVHEAKLFFFVKLDATRSAPGRRQDRLPYALAKQKQEDDGEDEADDEKEEQKHNRERRRRQERGRRRQGRGRRRQEENE